MSRRPWSGLLLTAIIAAGLLLPSATTSGLADRPWPALLSLAPPDIDPDFAVLQRRANIALARLVEASHAVQ
jgi:hypothetical protein